MTTTGKVVINDNDDQTSVFTISGLTGASGTSPSFSLGNYFQGAIAVQGTWNSAVMILNGSWDGGTTWVALKDALGTAVSQTANGYQLLGAVAPLLQMAWGSGSSGTSLTAYVSLARPAV
jgi:hypothetical protein